jgi:hypothetical protein
MTNSPSYNMLLLPPSAFQSTSSFHSNNDKENQTKTVHEQLEQLQVEMGRLRTNNEAQKTSGRGKKNTFFLDLKNEFFRRFT